VNEQCKHGIENFSLSRSLSIKHIKRKCGERRKDMSLSCSGEQVWLSQSKNSHKEMIKFSPTRA